MIPGNTACPSHGISELSEVAYRMMELTLDDIMRAREHLAHASDSQITEEIGTASAEGLARHVPTGFTR